MSQFTEEEMIKLRSLISIAEEVKNEAQYRAAVRLVLKTWKNVVIGAAGFIAALILLKGHLADALTTMVK